jgi:hypothetical protein
LITGKKIKDSQSGMWVFSRKALSLFKLKSKGMALSEEIKMEALLCDGLKFAEVPIVYADRVGEVKLRKWRDGLGNILFLFKKRWEIFLRTVKPEKVGRRFGFVFTFCFFVGFFYLLLFRGSGSLGIFWAACLTFFLYFFGRFINNLIYGRDKIFF